jgi:RecA-family ATPase
MTLHISLPDVLEKRIAQHVQSGAYTNADELVSEALRRFFSLPTDEAYSAIFSDSIFEFEEGKEIPADDIDGLFAQGDALIDAAQKI